jgi:hypothetical protein
LLGNPVSGGVNTAPGPTGWGLGVKLTTSPCKKKFVENLLREKKILQEAKAHFWAVVPLMMMTTTRIFGK